MSLYEERKRLEQADGEPLHVLRVMPEQEVAVRCNGAGVLVVAGEWGLTAGDEARFVRPLAEMGYFVVAIDLVGGARATTAEDAAARRAAIDPERGIADIASALLYLKELAGGRLGVLGYDGAAGVVIEAAARLPQIDCVIAGCGSAPRKDIQLSRSRSSIMIHRGTKTSELTGELYLTLAKRIEPAMQRMLLTDYELPDSFFARPVTNDERDAATAALDAMNSFLSSNLI